MGNKTTKRALASAAAMCLVLSSAPTFAAETTVPETTELSGKGRIQTAIRIAEEGWEHEFKGSKNAVLTAGADANLVDALAVSPLAYQLKAPILLNDAKDTINADTLKALKDNGVTKVYLATGEGVISEKAASQLKQAGIEVERLGGNNRYETAKNILDAFKENGGNYENVALVSGTNGLADALSVSSIAAKKGMPIILTEGKDKVAAGLDEIVKAAEKVYAIGGTGVISDALVNQIKADRLGGNNRYETNAAVIKAFAEAKSVSFDKVYLANGQNGHLVDALTGSVLAAQTSSPIVLGDEKLNTEVKNVLSKNVKNETKVVSLGGDKVVSPELIKEVQDIIKNATPEDNTAPEAPVLNVTDGTVAREVQPVATSVDGVVFSYDLTNVTTGEKVPYTGVEKLVDGQYKLVVTATKETNKKTATTTINFTVDNAAPTLEIDAKAETVGKAEYKLAGKVETGATVKVNDDVVEVKDGKFEATLTLKEGKNTITVVAIDAAGNNAKATKVVTYDVTAPEAPVVKGVAEGDKTNKDVTPEVEAVEGVTLSAVLEKDGVKVDGYKLGDVVKEEGNYKLTVTATKDLNEKKTDVVVNFTVDKTAPTIKVADSKFSDYKTMTIALSEKVTGTPVVKVNGVVEKAENVALAEDGMSVVVTKTAGFVPGQYTVVVNGLKDVATNAMAADATVTVTKAASTIAQANIVTEKLQAGSAVVSLTAVDQYGQDKKLKAKDLLVKASYGSMPIGEGEIGDEGNVTITSAALIKDRQINVDVYAKDKNGNYTVKVASKILTVVNETLKANTIASITRTDVNVGKDIKAGDTGIELTAKVLDQFGNPMTELEWKTKDTEVTATKYKLRWTTSDSKVVKFATDGDKIASVEDGVEGKLNIQLTAVANGTATITAYLPDGSAAQTFTVQVVDGQLALISVADAFDAVTNKATLDKANIAVNSFAKDGTTLNKNSIAFFNKTSSGSAIPVKAADVSFEVVPDTGFAATDVTVEKVADANGNLTGLKVTSNRTTLSDGEKAGNYTDGVDYTVKVKSNVTGVAEKTITVKTTIDKDVASVETEGTVAFRANNKVTKAITFKNEYGEVLNVTADRLKLVEDYNVTAKVQKVDDKGVYSAAEAGDVVKGIEYTSSAKANYSVAVQVDGKLQKTVSVAVSDASKLASINLGADVTTGVVSNDPKAIIPIELKDQDQNAMLVDPTDLQVVSATLENTEVKEAFVLGYYTHNKDGNIVTTDDATKAEGVALIVDTTGAQLNNFDVDKVVSVKVDNKLADEDKLEDIANVTVKAKRVLDKLAITPSTGNAVVGAKVSYKLSGIDQYGKEFDISSENDSVKLVAQDGISLNDKEVDGKNVTFTLSASEAGKYVARVYIDGKTADVLDDTDKYVDVKLNVGQIGDIVNSVKFSSIVNDYDSSKYQVKFKKGVTQVVAEGYDVAGNKVASNEGQIIYSIDNVVSTNETKPDLSIEPKTGVISGENVEDGDKVVVRATSLNGKTTTMTITLGTSNGIAQAGTYFLSNDADGYDKDGNEVVSLANVELKDDDKSTVGVNESEAKLYVVARDQYGKLINVDENKFVIGQDSSAYFTTEVKDSSTSDEKSDDFIAVKKVDGKVGTSTLRVFLNGTQVTNVTITVK